MSAATYDHEAFLNDKYDVTGVDLEPAGVMHVAPALDRPALCLEATGTHKPLGVVLASPGLPACPECLAIAELLDTFRLEDLARLLAGVAVNVPVLPIAWRIDTEALPVRDLATRAIVAVRLLCDPATHLSVIKADLWQEIRAERPLVYAALCARDLQAAYVVPPEADQ